MEGSRAEIEADATHLLHLIQILPQGWNIAHACIIPFLYTHPLTQYHGCSILIASVSYNIATGIEVDSSSRYALLHQIQDCASNHKLH